MALIMRNEQDKIEVKDRWQEYLFEVAKICLEKEEVDLDAEISLLFVDDAKIQVLNREYRNIDKKTDVLSFPVFESKADIFGEEILLGDIIISLERALEQSQEYGHSLDREIAYLMTHGLLHLLGYDHMLEDEKKIMRQKEEEILEKINLVRE